MPFLSNLKSRFALPASVEKLLDFNPQVDPALEQQLLKHGMTEKLRELKTPPAVDLKKTERTIAQGIKSIGRYLVRQPGVFSAIPPVGDFLGVLGLDALLLEE